MKRVLATIVIALGAWAATGLYFVQPDELALVRRCGKLVSQAREPGAHFGFPWGIDRIERIKPREVKRVNVGMVGLAGETSGGAGLLFLTGDRNLVNVRATIQYAITSPADYVRQQEVVDSVVATAGEAVMARIFAVQPVDVVLTGGKTEAATNARRELQARVDLYELGIAVRSVDLAALEPPPEVAESFADVIAAQREREQAIHQAQGYANQVLSQGRADSQRLVDEARADREQRVREAAGEADRFEQMLVEYQRAPTLTSRRLYWEAMSEILPRLRAKLIVDSGQQIDLSVFSEDRKKP